MTDPVDELRDQIALLREEIAMLREAVVTLNRKSMWSDFERRERGL